MHSAWWEKPHTQLPTSCTMLLPRVLITIRKFLVLSLDLWTCPIQSELHNYILIYINTNQSELHDLETSFA